MPQAKFSPQKKKSRKAIKMFWLNNCMGINTFSHHQLTQLAKRLLRAYTSRIEFIFNNERDKNHFHDRKVSKNLPPHFAWIVHVWMFLMMLYSHRNENEWNNKNNNFRFAALRYLLLRDHTKHCMNKTNERHTHTHSGRAENERERKRNKSCAV